MLEFALVAPVLVVLVLGVFDLGSAVSANVTVTNSSREGARLITGQITQHNRTDTQGVVGVVFGVIGCPTGSTSSPTAPAAVTGEGAAWRQLTSANLTLKSVTKMEVRFYAKTNDPANGGSPDDVFTCTQSSSTWSGPTECPGTCNASGTYTPAAGSWAQFETDYTYTPVTPVISHLIATVNVAQTTTMVLE